MTAATLLAMAAAMDSVVGPMSMIPERKIGVRKGNKYAGMKAYSGKQETERRRLRAERKELPDG
jgi:hypothetical protein